MNLALQYKDTLVVDRTEVCCPAFEPSEWDYAQHDWANKLFLKESAFSWNNGKAIARMLKKAKEAKAIPHDGNTLVLAHSASAFKTELFVAVTKQVSDQDTARLSGTFISRVFEGPNNKLSAYERSLNGYLASLGKMARKHYFYSPYCSQCARKHGHNYIVVFAETKPIDPYH